MVSLLKDGDRVCGAFAYERERGYFHVFRAKAIVLATGGIGRAYKITSNSLGVHRRRAHARVRRRRRAHRHGVRAVPPDGHGVAAVGARHPRHRRRARRGRRPQEQRGPPLHVRRHPRQLQTADGGQRRRGLALHAGRQDGAPPARAAHARSRRALHRARGQGGARLAARRRLPRHRVDQAARQRRRRPHQEEAAVDVPPVHQAGERRHHHGADGSRADDALRDGRHSRRRRLADVDHVPGLFAAGECAAGINGANRLGGNSLSDLLVFGKRAGEYAAKYAKEQKAAGKIDEAQLDAAAKRALAPFEREGSADGSLSDPARAAGDDAGARRHRARRGGDDARGGGHRRAAQEGRRRRGQGQPRVQPGLVDGARPAQPAHGVGGGGALGAVAQGVARRTLPRRLPSRRATSGRPRTSCSRRAPTAQMQITTASIPPMPAELKEAIEGEKK